MRIASKRTAAPAALLRTSSQGLVFDLPQLNHPLADLPSHKSGVNGIALYENPGPGMCKDSTDYLCYFHSHRIHAALKITPLRQHSSYVCLDPPDARLLICA